MLVFRMALAALVSGMAAGALLILFIALTMVATASPGGWWSAGMLVGSLPTAIFGGLVVATLPALLAGACMRTLEADFPAARHPIAWAAVGAGVGGGFWTLFGLVLGSVGADGIDPVETALLASMILAGAGAALAFLAVMRLTGMIDWLR